MKILTSSFKGTADSDVSPGISDALRDVADDLAAIADLPALTSVQNATAADLPTAEALANALKTSFNALQTDVAAIRAAIAGAALKTTKG